MPRELFPFRFRDSVTGKWVRARYVTEHHEIAARYKEWEIAGAPEIRGDPDDGRGYFRPHPSAVNPAANVERYPGLDSAEQFLVLLFLRRYVTYCAGRRHFAQMEGAAELIRALRRP